MGMIINQIGTTYQADHAGKDGNVAESAIDHVYHSTSINDQIKVHKLSISAACLVPISRKLNNS